MIPFKTLQWLKFEIATTSAKGHAWKLPRHSTSVGRIVPCTVPSPPSLRPVERRNNFEPGYPMIPHHLYHTVTWLANFNSPGIQAQLHLYCKIWPRNDLTDSSMVCWYCPWTKSKNAVLAYTSHMFHSICYRSNQYPQFYKFKTTILQQTTYSCN